MEKFGSQWSVDTQFLAKPRALEATGRINDREQIDGSDDFGGRICPTVRN
jgi:hypothetical protein